jgi:hypothetical protein
MPAVIQVEIAGCRGRRRKCKTCGNAGRAAHPPVKLPATSDAASAGMPCSQKFAACGLRAGARMIAGPRLAPRFVPFASMPFLISCAPEIRTAIVSHGAPLHGSDILPAQRRSLLELSDDTCKWPVGDPATPDFFYCGAPAHNGRPYCEHHCLRAYRPLWPNKPKRGSARWS